MFYILFFAVLQPVIFIVFVLFIHKKLTQLRRRNKELENLNTAKDKLFTVIGHDLNSTINGIPPTILLYRDKDTTAEEKEFLLSAIEEKIYFAGNTLQSLLSWGKLQLKGITISQGYFNAAEVVKAKLELIKIVAKNKELTIIDNLPAEAGIYADIQQFRFIIRNLLSNAVKFSRTAGTIEINLDKQPDFTVLSIKDSGEGIAKERLQQIFQPFNISTEGTSKETGNGIGLMLCKEYAQKNGGDIWAQSEDKVGTIFYLALKSSNHSQSFRPYPLKTESYGN
jgi:signal transduction histidine kinase